MHPLFKDTLIYMLGKLIPAAVGLLSVVIYVRMLGEEQYGTVALVISATILVGNCGAAWLSQSLLRFGAPLATNTYGRHALLGSVLQQGITHSALLGALISVAYLMVAMKEQDVTLLVIAATLVVVHTAYTVFSSYHSSLLNPRLVVRVDAIRVLISLLLGILLIRTTSIGFYGVLAGMTVGIAVGLVVLIRDLPLIDLQDQKKHKALLRKFRRYGMPLALWMMISYILNFSDRYMIYWMMEPSDVGVYSAIYDVVFRSFTLLLTPVLLASHPRIMHLWAQGKSRESLAMIRGALLLQVGVSVVGITALVLFSDFLVHLVLGHADSSAEKLVLPVAVGAMVWQIAMFAHKPHEMKGRTRTMLFAVTVSAAGNIALNWLFIPFYGYVAAAYATVAAAGIYMVIIAVTSISLTRKENKAKVCSIDTVPARYRV